VTNDGTFGMAQHSITGVTGFISYPAHDQMTGE
jgi:hypothetical protein